MRKELVDCIDSSLSCDLLAEPYHYQQLQQNLETGPPDSLSLLQMDKIFTDAAIGFMKNVFEGYESSPWVSFDQVSPKYENDGNEFLLDQLRGVHSPMDLRRMMLAMQPKEQEYQLLKQELRTQKQNGDKKKIQQIVGALNHFRWIHHFGFQKVIVVNIASASLRYYENDSAKLSMRVVVGKPSTPTPRFATWCDEVILYPYWYVPRKIALNEYLYRFKRNPALIDAMNMQVIDKNGKILNHYKLDWSSINKSYFPYTLRQSTGCDNALGVIKFNVTSPYGVYLHDTNNKSAFLSASRYYSHGCIRIEKPIDLGNHLLKNSLDTTFLQSCYNQQKPISIKLDQPVPLFVVYMPAEPNGAGKITYYRDVYKLLK